MTTKIKSILGRKVLFLFLLPIMWVLHGYLNNYGLIPEKDALLLALLYCGVALVLAGIFWLFYRNIFKAALLSFVLLCLQFFFGPIHDFLKETFPGTIFSKYSFLLPFIFILVIATAVYLARSKKTFYRTTTYLNTLFLIFIITDSFLLAFSNSKREKNNTESNFTFSPCDTCSKPDIYLIVADGYPGNRQLKDLFRFDNSDFENALRQRGFFIVDSSMSNYNFTPFSIASMLDMNYLNNIRGINSDKNDMRICYNTIKNAQLFHFLKKINYRIYNFSIFDLENQPSFTKPTFLQRKTKPILSQTLLYRLKQDLGYHLASTLRIQSVIKNLRKKDLHNNNSILKKTISTPTKINKHPKFIYAHLVMPHYPYYFDSSGNETNYKFLTEEYNTNKDAFIGYLKYANKVYLKLIDTIKSQSEHEPIIIFLSDHGFREFEYPVKEKYHFMNINALNIPKSSYKSFYKGLSNINTFRIILKEVFNQKIELINDSTSFLID